MTVKLAQKPTKVSTEKFHTSHLKLWVTRTTLLLKH